MSERFSHHGSGHKIGSVEKNDLTRGTTAIAAAVAGDVEAIHIMGTAIRGIIQGLRMKVLVVNQKLPLFWLVTRPELKTFNDPGAKRWP
jgi:hypothetical protein